MKILLDYTKQELMGLMLNWGEEKYRAEQLFNAMQNGKNYDDKINVPKSLIEKLRENEYLMQPIKVVKQLSSKDKNIKYLYQLYDGSLVEGMLMKYKFGNTLCVSTQVGCKMNCAFCASSLNGFVRNLSAGEILGQVTAVNNMLGGNTKDRQITNIVLMGCGEPMDNFDNVTKFLKLVTSEDGFNFSSRNISVSTCGIPSKIEELADLGYACTLCISLHAPNDHIRQQIMPIARKYSIHEVLEAARYFHSITNRRFIIEYTLIKDVNDSYDDAKELAELVKDYPCHINLIKLNEVKERGLKAPSQDTCEKFLTTLYKYKVSATLRRTIGDDVDGACGQLRFKAMNENKSTPVNTKPMKIEKVSKGRKNTDDKPAKSRGSKMTSNTKGKSDSKKTLGKTFKKEANKKEIGKKIIKSTKNRKTSR